MLWVMLEDLANCFFSKTGVSCDSLVSRKVLLSWDIILTSCNENNLARKIRNVALGAKTDAANVVGGIHVRPDELGCRGDEHGRGGWICKILEMDTGLFRLDKPKIYRIECATVAGLLALLRDHKQTKTSFCR